MQTLTRERQTLEQQGYVVLCRAVDSSAVATALRLADRGALADVRASLAEGRHG